MMKNCKSFLVDRYITKFSFQMNGSVDRQDRTGLIFHKCISNDHFFYRELRSYSYKNMSMPWLNHS